MTRQLSAQVADVSYADGGSRALPHRAAVSVNSDEGVTFLLVVRAGGPRKVGEVSDDQILNDAREVSDFVNF